MPIFWGFVLAGVLLVIFGSAVIAVLMLDKKAERETRWKREGKDDTTRGIGA